MLLVNQPKRCARCKKVKAADNFSRDRSRAEGRFPYCMACQVTTTAKFQNDDELPNGNICPLDDKPVTGHKNRKFCSEYCKTKVSRLRIKYNLDISDYRRLVEATGGHCPICKDRATTWQVDHNHTSLAVTGVVCINCNVGLLADSRHDLERVIALFQYLSETPAAKLGIVALANPRHERDGQLHKVWNQARYRPKGTLGRNQFSK